MLADDIADRIAAANHPAELHDIHGAIWVEHAHGRLTINDTEVLSEAFRARREALQGPRSELPTAAKRAPRGPARRRQRSPDRAASIERRRRLAASGPMPPALAARFTTSELAVMRIIGDECRAKGFCDLHIDAIAARAGTCRTVVKGALREATHLNLMTVTERRRAGQRSLTNLCTVISPEWVMWLRRGGGVGKPTTTDRREERPSQTTTRATRGYRLEAAFEAENQRRRKDPGG